MKITRPHSESGVVLIAVLAGILLLTMIAFSLSSSVRATSEELRERKENLQAHYLARGAVLSVSWLLSQMSGAKDSVLHPGQQAVDWSLANGKVHVDLIDEGGKIDLNRVQAPLLEQLLVALGHDLEVARPLAASIVDWRDPSSLARWERAQASGDLLEYDPSHALQSKYGAVEELLNVPGMKPEIFYGRYVRRPDAKVQRLPGLVDCVTVDSGSPRININYAAYPVLVAVTGMSTRTADFIVEGRTEKPFASVDEVTREFPASLTSGMISTLTTQNSGTFTLLATGQLSSGVVARIRAVVKTQGLQNRPFQILRWKDSHVR